MTFVKRFMLAAAMIAGTLGMTAAPAQAARIGVGVYVGAPAYVAQSPGPGYVWVAGYWDGGVWVPGYWNYVGFRVGAPFVRGRVVIGHPPVYNRHFGPAPFRR